MIIVSEQQEFHSPYVEWAGYGQTVSDGVELRPAEYNWHLIFTRQDGVIRALVVGGLEAARPLSYVGGAESLWIRFKLGTFLPKILPITILNRETSLPMTERGRFWLRDRSWEIPTLGTVDTFVKHLVRDGALIRDPVVSAVLRGEPINAHDRTIRYHFRQSTGVPQSFVHQITRARRAVELLQQGYSPLDTAFDLGYADQPHLSRSLKRFVGLTPREIQSPNTSE